MPVPVAAYGGGGSAGVCAAAQPGTNKLWELDFTTLGIASWGSTGAQSLGGVDFDVNTLAASSTFTIGASGLTVAGGTGLCALGIELTSLTGWPDTTDPGNYYVIQMVMDADDGSEIAFQFGGDTNNRFFVERDQDSGNIQTKSYIGGTFDTDQTDAVAGSAVRMIGASILGSAIETWYDTVDPGRAFPWTGSAVYSSTNARRGQAGAIWDGTGGNDWCFLLFNGLGARSVNVTHFRIWYMTPTSSKLQAL